MRQRSQRYRFDLSSEGQQLPEGMHALGQGGAPIGAVTASQARVRLDGRFFKLGDEKFWVKGVTYGPFEPQPNGVCLPEQHQLEADLRQIAGLGANVVRVYHVPPRSFLPPFSMITSASTTIPPDPANTFA